MTLDSLKSIELQPHELARILLDRAKISNNQLAVELGVTQAHISAVIRRLRKSRFVEAHIADRLGVPVDVLFPIDEPKRKASTDEPRYPEGHETMGGL